MYLKEIKLNENDLKLLYYLARYKLMFANDAIYFYGSTYYQKRLQQLKNANYITRYYRIYIKLSSPAIRFLQEQNIKCESPCRNKSYIKRLLFISKLGIEFEKAKLPIKLSWEMKGKNYSDWSRRFLGETLLRNEKYIIYNTKMDNSFNRTLHFDINKDLEYQNIIILTDDLNVIDNQKRFVFPNKVVSMIVPINRIQELGIYNRITIKDEIEKYYGCNAENSDYSIADYKIGDTNIIYMPFIDTHRVMALNSFFSLAMTDSKFDILTLKDNLDKLTELLSSESLNMVDIKTIELKQGDKL